MSRSISSREQVRPAVCRSRRRSGSASTRAARPCSWAPRRVRSTVPWRTVTCTSTGPRVSGVRTRVIVCRPSGAWRSTATCRATCEATGWAGGAAAGVASGAAIAVGPAADGAAPTVGTPSVVSPGAAVGATAAGAEPVPVPSPASAVSEPPAARRRSMPVTGAVDAAASGSPDGAAVATGEGVTTGSGAAASTVTTVTPASAARVSGDAPAAALPGEGTVVRSDAGAVRGTTVPVGDVPTTAGGGEAGEGGEAGTAVRGSAAAGTAAAMSPGEACAAPTGSAVAAAVTAGGGAGGAAPPPPPPPAGAPPAPPPGAGAPPAGLPAFEDVWPAVIERLQADGDTLLAASAGDGWPVALDGDALALGFPPTAAFSMRKVASAKCRDRLSTAVREVTGVRVRIDTVVHDAPSPSRVPVTLSEDEFVARVVAEFDAEELPPEPDPKES